jgi:uncharacterized protein
LAVNRRAVGSERAPVSPRADVIARTEDYVRDELSGDSSGHDWWHVDRVRKLALRLAREEGADELVVELAALLHDVADYKFSGSPDAGPQAAREWLVGQGADVVTVEHVAEIVAKMSFKGARVPDAELSLEGRCVRDADRLDAIGAIGIARAFAFGGHKGRMLHDPTVEPQPHTDPDAYMRAQTTTINHFYEKLLLLEERMSTDSARRIAAHRQRVMQAFMEEFHAEWNADDG